jgi:hypothetical protein
MADISSWTDLNTTVRDNPSGSFTLTRDLLTTDGRTWLTGSPLPTFFPKGA